MDLAEHFLRFEHHALQRGSVMNTNSSEPGLNVCEIKVACLQKLHHFRINGHGFTIDLPAVDAQKHIRCSKSNTLVAIEKLFGSPCFPSKPMLLGLGPFNT